MNKPLIQYAAEEAIAAGIDTLIFVTGRNKRSIEDHFDANNELEAALSSIAKAKGERAPEILSEHLRQANRNLERILGKIDIEEVLGRIFSKFCIGK